MSFLSWCFLCCVTNFVGFLDQHQWAKRHARLFAEFSMSIHNCRIVSWCFYFPVTRTLMTSLVESLCVWFDWALTVARGQHGNFTIFSCPLVGYRFRFLRHVSAHVPLTGSFIRGRLGILLFTSSLLFPPPPLLHLPCTSELLRSPRA
jgi:hypothetical protein